MGKTFDNFVKKRQRRVIINTPGKKNCLVFSQPSEFSKNMSTIDIGDAVFQRILERKPRFQNLAQGQKRIMKIILRPVVQVLADLSFLYPEILETLYQSGKRRVIVGVTTSSPQEIKVAAKHRRKFARYVLNKKEFKANIL